MTDLFVAPPHTDRPVRARLAPSPTGALHLGNARSFLLAWLSARQQGGEIYLRIEDIDSPRVKPESVHQTIEDLSWLGLDWDQSDLQTDEEPILQSGRMPRFLEVLEELIQAERLYVCKCSRKDVAEAASAPHDTALPALEGDVYPGTCRDACLKPELLDKFAWRWKFADAKMQWTDRLRGLQQANPARQLGDYVIAKLQNGVLVPAYQLAVVVDDYDQGITEVVRGDDLIFSTYRQLTILRHLNWAPPDYIHVPLVIGPDSRRLAKRHGDTRLAFFREAGIRAESIVGYLAHSIGLIDQRADVTAQELVGELDWEKISTEPTVFEFEREYPGLN